MKLQMTGFIIRYLSCLLSAITHQASSLPLLFARLPSPGGTVSFVPICCNSGRVRASFVRRRVYEILVFRQDCQLFIPYKCFAENTVVVVEDTFLIVEDTFSLTIAQQFVLPPRSIVRGEWQVASGSADG